MIYRSHTRLRLQHRQVPAYLLPNYILWFCHFMSQATVYDVIHTITVEAVVIIKGGLYETITSTRKNLEFSTRVGTIAHR